MLGFHPLLQRDLHKNGRRAFATVLSVQRTHVLNTQGDPSLVSSTQRLWKLVVRVEPEGEPPFEAKLDAWYGQLSDPTGTEKVPVLYDPDDHTKVMVDDSAEGASALVDDEVKARTDETVAKMRARGQNELADRYQAVFDAGLTTDWSNDPAELRKQLRERHDKIQAIMAGQGPDAQQRLIRDAMASYAPQVQELREALGGATGGTSTADELTKLADLRDRGVLTDAEFDAQKKKLLGE
jgi:hypothetical protein